MQPSNSDNPPVFLLVDGHSLAFRAYYAFAYRADGGLRTSTGIPTSVCFGFLNSLLDLLSKEQPAAIAIAFDLAVPTFRHEADTTYKAGRAETPEEFIPDLQNLQRILTAMQIATVSVPGYEADDAIGTLAMRASAAGYAVKIFSGDRDLFQLVSAERRISVLHPERDNSITEYHAAEVRQRMGVMPEQVVDFKALCGDTSDNIPGVRGIGEKTAAKLMAEYGSLENILAAIPQMKGAVRAKLEQGIEAAKHSQYLARIVLDVPLDLDLETCRLAGFDREAVMPLLEELELKAFARKIDEIHGKFGGIPPIKFAGSLPDEEDGDLWFEFAAAAGTADPPIATLDVWIVNTPEDLDRLLAILETCDRPVAWDTETTSLNPHDAELVGIGCCWDDAPAAIAYIPLGHTAGTNCDRDLALARLRPMLESGDRPKILQNAKYDRLVLRRAGIALAGVCFDPMLASYVLDPEGNHSLDEMARSRLQMAKTAYKDLVGKRPSIAEVDIPSVAQYCGADAYATYRLYPLLRAELEAIPDLLRLFAEVELPLEAVLAEMEWTGIRIDTDYLSRFSDELEADLQAIASRAIATAGREFNLNSPKQLSALLEERLGEGFTKKSRKSKTGYSTDVAVLEKLQGEDPLVDAILEHRTLAKLKSTYVDALPALVHPATQRVHTDFNQAVTATGRLSSSNPNLQNIPIRTAFSRRIRAAFVPEPGWKILAADYSQIELRILAHLSGEPELVRAYNDRIDVHTRTAQLLLDKEEVTSEERRLAKIVNYGVIYGMGAQKFSRETGISVAAAKQFIATFEQRYARIFAYKRDVEEMAARQGYVTTILGRRRYFRDLKHLSGNRKAALQRSAVNAPIQGTSADIIKVAMLHLRDRLREGGFQARLLLQVHDELVFEVPPEEVEDLAPLVKREMEGAIALSVPLEVDVHAGNNWMEAK